MKKILFYLLALTGLSANAQEQLPVVYLSKNLTLQFISPEPVQYVDISCKELAGDLPLKNVVRIRLKDTAGAFENAVITIAGEKFIAQYRLLPGNGNLPSEINIVPADTSPLDIAGIGFSQNQLKQMSLNLFAEKPLRHAEKIKAFGVTGQLNHVYACGDYIFLDISYKNKTRLNYDIDVLRFKIDDKKITKASNVQSVALNPVFSLFDAPSFKKYYRNVFVLKKLSFPGSKVLHIELTEKQLSGRVINLTVSYQDILDADLMPSPAN